MKYFIKLLSKKLTLSIFKITKKYKMGNSSHLEIGMIFANT